MSFPTMSQLPLYLWVSRVDFYCSVEYELLSVELDSEATDVSDGIRTAAASQNGREANEDGCSARGIGQDTSR